MLKKLFSSLSLSFLCITAANAFNQIDLPNGKGSIYQNDAANIYLDSLNSQFVYNLSCHVSDPNGDKTPTIFRVDIAGMTVGFNTTVLFDGNALATQQAQIIDNKPHTIEISGVRFEVSPMGGKPVLTITRLDGGQGDYLAYDCTASYAIGK